MVSAGLNCQYIVILVMITNKKFNKALRINKKSKKLVKL